MTVLDEVRDYIRYDLRCKHPEDAFEVLVGICVAVACVVGVCIVLPVMMFGLVPVAKVYGVVVAVLFGLWRLACWLTRPTEE